MPLVVTPKGYACVRLVAPEGRLSMILSRHDLTREQERMLRELRPHFREYPNAARSLGVARVFASAAFMSQFDAITGCTIVPMGMDVMLAPGEEA
jgi:hypothetical protein